jgi:hypothetical protein
MSAELWGECVAPLVALTQPVSVLVSVSACQFGLDLWHAAPAAAAAA